MCTENHILDNQNIYSYDFSRWQFLSKLQNDLWVERCLITAELTSIGSDLDLDWTLFYGQANHLQGKPKKYDLADP